MGPLDLYHLHIVDRKAWDSNRFVLCLDKDKRQIRIEKRGVWTWLKAHMLYPKDYQLSRISRALTHTWLKQEEASRLVESLDLTEFEQAHPRRRVVSNRLKSVLNRALHPVFEDTRLFIQDFLLKLLTPYFSGEITPENEVLDRPSFMQQLLIAYEEQYPDLAPDEEIFKETLKQFFALAASHFNRVYRSAILAHKKELVRLEWTRIVHEAEAATSDEEIRLYREFHHLKTVALMKYRNLFIFPDSQDPFHQRAFDHFFEELKRVLPKEFEIEPDDLQEDSVRRLAKGALNEVIRQHYQGKRIVED